MLAAATPETMLARAGEAAVDWAGGTRIGAAVHDFMDRYGVRGMARGSVILIISDGWETGDPALLGAQMARLHRLPAGPPGHPQRAAHVQANAVLARPVPASPPRRHGDHQFPHQGGQLPQLGVRQRAEVPPAEPLGGRRDPPQHRDLGRLVIPGFAGLARRRLHRGGNLPLQRRHIAGGTARCLISRRGAVRVDLHARPRRDNLRAARNGTRVEQLREDPLERLDLPGVGDHRRQRAGVQFGSHRSGPAGIPAERSATPSTVASVA